MIGKSLYKMFVDYDCSLVEINPLVHHRRRRYVIALDAKVNFDDNALFRHKDLAENTAIWTKKIPLEIEASKLQPQLHQPGRRR